MYQVAYDVARVALAASVGYCAVKIAWEAVYEMVPDAFRSTELARASEKELERELGQAWNPREGRPMSEREFLVLRSLERRAAVEAEIGWDRPVDMSEADMAAYARAQQAARQGKRPVGQVWPRVEKAQHRQPSSGTAVN